MALESANPILHKSSMELQFAGTGLQNPILNGFAARLTLNFAEDETLISWRIFTTDTGFSKNLPVVQDTEGDSVVADILHGTDSVSSADGQRNFIEWVTNRGTTKRQFFVKNLPESGSLYIENQECQASEAIIFASIDGAPVTEENENAAKVSMSINILPNFADEFFTLHSFSGNRFANTIRAWGGAATAALFIDGIVAIDEKPIEDFDGFFWESRPLVPPADLPVSYGQHTVTVRLRAKLGSANAVDIDGVIRIRQIPDQI